MRQSLVHLAALAVVLPAGLAAQSSNDLRKAADRITPKLVYERISVIAHDSMGGRNTPSPGLEKTAEYLVSIYEKAGLKPAGENGTWYQRYPLVKKRVNQATAFLELNENGTVSRYPMGEFAYASGEAPGKQIVGESVLLAGTMTVADVEPLDLTGKIVMIVFDAAKAIDWNRVAQVIVPKKPAALILIRNDAPEAFARSRDRAGSAVLSLDTPSGTPLPLVISLHDQAFANDPMQANRPDLPSMRFSPTPIIMPIPETIAVTVFAETEVLERMTAPNVVAKIEGSDPVLKNEYVVYSAHMDHVGTVGDGIGGCTNRGDDDPTDMICNGADDDASGTIGVAMVAEAFGKLSKKPRRSILIVNVSGEEKGLWGSEWFSDHPTVPLEKMVANVNLDMIGRNNPDSIVVIGQEHSDLGSTLARVNAGRPELKMTTSVDLWPNESFYTRSDHFNFARYGVPVLFFFNGVHPQYHRVGDHVDLIDTDKLARVAKIAFYLGAEVANAPARPVWDPAAYEKYVIKK
jgi:hypothetical protein